MLSVSNGRLATRQLLHSPGFRNQARKLTQVSVISAPVSSAALSSDEPWRRQQQQQQQQQQLAEEDTRLLLLIKSLRAEADLLKVLEAGLSPVWMTHGELQQLVQHAPRSGACIGQASRGTASWHRPAAATAAGSATSSSLHVSSSSSSIGRQMEPATSEVAATSLALAVETAGDEAAAAEFEPLTGVPQVVNANFEMWSPGVVQPLLFDPLAADVVPGELEDPDASYPPLISCLQDWRMFRDRQNAAPAKTHFCDQHSDVIVATAEEDEEEEQQQRQSGAAACEPVATAAGAAEAMGATAAAALLQEQEAPQQAAAAPSTAQVNVSFRVKCKTQFGQRLWLVGDHAVLGGWDLSKWIKMQWTAGDVWQADVAVELPGGATALTTINYKTVLEMTPGGEKCWTAGDSWKLQVAGPGPVEAYQTHKQ